MDRWCNRWNQVEEMLGCYKGRWKSGWEERLFGGRCDEDERYNSWVIHFGVWIARLDR